MWLVRVCLTVRCINSVTGATAAASNSSVSAALNRLSHNHCMAAANTVHSYALTVLPLLRISVYELPASATITTVDASHACSAAVTCNTHHCFAPFFSLSALPAQHSPPYSCPSLPPPHSLHHCSPHSPAQIQTNGPCPMCVCGWGM